MYELTYYTYYFSETYLKFNSSQKKKHLPCTQQRRTKKKLIFSHHRTAVYWKYCLSSLFIIALYDCMLIVQTCFSLNPENPNNNTTSLLCIRHMGWVVPFVLNFSFCTALYTKTSSKWFLLKWTKWKYVYMSVLFTRYIFTFSTDYCLSNMEAIKGKVL